MADKRISELTAAGALTGAEQIPVVQGGTTKRTTLTDALDFGAYVPSADRYLIAAGGESVLSRDGGLVHTLGLGSGTTYLTYFTAKRSEPITKVRVRTGTTAAGATPTLVRIGVWTVAADDSLVTLVASTANDTTLLAAATTRYEKALQASWDKVGGVRYAAGILVVSGAALPTMVGYQLLNAGIGDDLAVAPRLNAGLNGQADLPASAAVGTMFSQSRIVNFEFAA